MTTGQTAQSRAAWFAGRSAARDRKYGRLMDPANRIHFVYAIFDADLNCLYVGRSNNPTSRWAAHRGNPKAPWTDKADSFRKVGPLPYDVALRLEREYIEDLQPLHNRMFTIAHGWAPKSKGQSA